MGVNHNPKNGFTEISGAALRKLDAERARTQAAASSQPARPAAHCQDVYVSQRGPVAPSAPTVPVAAPTSWQAKYEALLATVKAHLDAEQKSRDDKALDGFAALGANTRAPLDIAWPVNQSIDAALGVFDAHPVKADLVTDLVLLRRRLAANLQAGQPGSYTAAEMAGELRAILARIDAQRAVSSPASPQGLALEALRAELFAMIEGQAATQRPW